MEISTNVQKSILKERTLKAKLNEIASQIPTLQEAIKEAESQYGWKDSYLSGLFGGNRSLVKSVDNMRDELESLQKEEKKLTPQFKKLKKSVREELSKLVSPVDSDFEVAVTEKDRWLNLERKSKAYKNLVLKAEQGIKDALLFLSWEKLVNHPEANSKLKEFKAETAKYQNVISGMEQEIITIKGKVIVFQDLIKFSSEHVAMESFRKLVNKSNDYYQMSYDQVEDCLVKIDARLDKEKSKVS
ncbi:MAG: hypothetical protein NXI20_19340 [bacterium]|nr:hypothetical protein [bacterium]